MLVFLCGAPNWRPENIWNLLWLSGAIIICTEQINIKIATPVLGLTMTQSTTLPNTRLK